MRNSLVAIATLFLVTLSTVLAQEDPQRYFIVPLPIFKTATYQSGFNEARKRIEDGWGTPMYKKIQFKPSAKGSPECFVSDIPCAFFKDEPLIASMLLFERDYFFAHGDFAMAMRIDRLVIEVNELLFTEDSWENVLSEYFGSIDE